MKKIYQTIFKKGNGNCLQAAAASLLEIDLELVPHFISHGAEWYEVLFKFIMDSGYEFKGTIYNPRQIGCYGGDSMPTIVDNKGVSGLFIGIVYSPSSFTADDLAKSSACTHAVIIDKEFRIVHDPNPNNIDIFDYPLFDQLDYHGILEFYLIEKSEK